MPLITPTEVINTAFTNRNTDTYLIKPSFIDIAELNHIKPNIGVKLYESLLSTINTPVACIFPAVSCGVTINSNLITCAANSDIAVGDFVTGPDIPSNAAGSINNGFYPALCKVEEVFYVGGLVTSFTISGAATSTLAASPITFERPNCKLINSYLKNYLAFCVKFEVLPDMTYNTTSQGVVELVAEFALPVSQRKLSFLREETLKKSETYLRSMRLFIENNCDVYPDYINDNLGGVSKRGGIIIY